MKYRICQDIEEALDQMMETASEFDMLAEKIQQSTKVYISPTTLKRMWGYIKEDVNPRKTTLNALAEFLGYKNYNAYERDHRESVQSGVVREHKITDKEIGVNSSLSICWAPNRQCSVRHLGDGKFEVKESVNSKLQRGDTFTCHLIIEHEPMYMDNLIRDGKEIGCYVAGRRDGVRFTMIDDDRQ